ncbi:MAG: hypothetical protein ACPGXY_02055 [Alphaproteobacteria bacterium]
MIKETELKISGVGFPSWSARGCQQTLTPIRPDVLHRTVNGDLHYVGKPSYHKYTSVVTCEDKVAPAMNAAWRGSKLTISCLPFLWQQASGRSAELSRLPVAESIVVIDGAGQIVQDCEIRGTTVTLPRQIADGYVKYRPILQMLLTDFQVHQDEWGKKLGWKLSLEEV